MPKFSDIPQLIGFGNYSITVGLTYVKRQLSVFTEECDLDLEPEFQRDYVWNHEQKERYIEFLLRGGNTGRDILFNYADWGVNVKSKRDLSDDPIVNRMVIVDGKQRLSAVTGFMDNNVKAFGYFYCDFTDKLRQTLVNLIFHVNELGTRKEILEWYLQLNSGGTVHTEEELTKVRKMIEQIEYKL